MRKGPTRGRPAPVPTVPPRPPEPTPEEVQARRAELAQLYARIDALEARLPAPPVPRSRLVPDIDPAIRAELDRRAQLSTREEPWPLPGEEEW